MANQLLVNPYPDGFDSTLATLTVNGSIQLFGSSVSTGEPINWNSLMDAVGYNEINYRGNGKNGTGTAQTTGFAVSTGTCTCTAANNFSAGEQVTFLGNTGTLSALFNGQVVTILTATTSAFTFLTTNTGTTTTGDVGMAVRYVPVSLPVPADGAVLSVTVSAISASAGVVTVTGTNNLLPGATVTFAGFASGTLGPKLIAAGPLVVASSTSTAFTIVSALTGTTGAGTATGSNPPVPFSVKFWSELASGYTYSYSSTTGVLFVQTGAGFTPAGTNSAPTITTTSGGVSTALGVAAGALSEVTGATGITGVQAPVFTGTPITAAILANLSAAAYPSGVLGDVIKFEAKFRKG